MVLASQSVDAITRLLIGVGWRSSRGFTPDVVAGADLRIGRRIRVRPTWHVRDKIIDSSIGMVF